MRSCCATLYHHMKYFTTLHPSTEQNITLPIIIKNNKKLSHMNTDYFKLFLRIPLYKERSLWPMTYFDKVLLESQKSLLGTVRLLFFHPQKIHNQWI